MNKKEYRIQVLNDLKKLSKPEHEQYSYEIACRLFEEPLWKEARMIGVTISNHPEVDTYQIIRKAWELNKIVVVPKCHPKEKQMSFHKISQFTQLETVYYGLFEPIINKTEKVEADQIDLLIVPGLAYNLQGYRLGFGGGYYDRFLTKYKGNTISIAFSIQLKDDLPIEEHDIPVSKIITNDKNFRIDDY
ncbi:5-formyltetrahydrofolate cyclo-ligase [Bacillus sp. CGMCC 1.16607]|uniref:5-formyltetrahydrofolate cyclo-ligase n=1 Tax=Bacillus sp. CGMCC 1.16607 TaxID=3351842 RepID=UPI00362B84D7